MASGPALTAGWKSSHRWQPRWCKWMPFGDSVNAPVQEGSKRYLMEASGIPICSSEEYPECAALPHCAAFGHTTVRPSSPVGHRVLSDTAASDKTIVATSQ
jgi:hypothetical protein